MTDESETAPLPEPVPAEPALVAEPVAAPVAAPAPAATPATKPAPATQPAPAAIAVPEPVGPRKRNRVLGTIGQVVAVVGLVVCLLLAVGVVVGRGWAVDTVDQVAASVDAKLAVVPPKLDGASQKVAEVAGGVGVVADAVQAAADNPGTVGTALQTLLGSVNGLSEKYLALRQSYADARNSIASAIGAAQAVDRLIPGLAIPQEPIQKLEDLDARIQELDTSIMSVVNAIPADGSVANALSGVADKITGLETKLSDVSGALADASARVQSLRADIASVAGTARFAINIGMFGGVLFAIYLALLHWVLFRWSGQLKKKPA